ncbi:S1C family serine protease [Streptomyces sp. IBSNAI002]|uniref:S1C family serine protease n=1 Tax=Streptomyces sp. IBSNAI002 TaxID=3457500 RepID=UPI003FD0DF6F
MLVGAAGGAAGALAAGAGASVEVRSVGPEAAARSGNGQDAGPVPGVAAAALRSTVTIDATRPGVHMVGTGFFFDSAGHILTNAHVVDPQGKPAKLTVTFADGSSSPAAVVGAAPGYDIAVVKLVGSHRPSVPLALGNSDDAVVGDPVVAVGAPFDLSGTVTSGILSALDRPVVTQNGTATAFLNALQTDAPINPGNSGGPLLDDAGQVIGINSAISAATSLEGGPASSVGLGFAIPIDQAKWVADSLVEHGTAHYAQLGLKVNNGFRGDGVQIMPESAKDTAAAITSGGPADKAGLHPGDLITAFDGRPVDSVPALIAAVWAHHPGDRTAITYERDGHTRTTTLVLGDGAGEA